MKSKLFFLGPEKTFSEEAAKIIIENSDLDLERFPLPSFESVAKSVSDSKNDYGVLAYYNYLEGLVQENLDLIYENNLQIIGVFRLSINFSIGGFKEGAKKIYSHPKALAQCSNWLWENFSGLNQIPVSSTAEAVDRVKTMKNGLAIASLDAFEESDLEICGTDVGNKKHGKTNFTDFYLVSRKNGVEFDSNKQYLTMVAITPHKDESGLLAKILNLVAVFNLNNAKIHSRPALDEVDISGSEPQMFYLEIEAHKDEIRFKDCVTALERVLAPEGSSVETVRVLGSYEKV
jgi:prephenate dehydratase